MALAHAVQIQANRPPGDDRAAVIAHAGGVVAVLADGAGGTGRGAAEAAESLITWTRALVSRDAGLQGAAPWHDLLTRADRQISMNSGQTTGVVVAVTEQHLVGASVGDSRAWLVGPSGFDDLTAGQSRKPLLGSGEAKVVSFERTTWQGTLLLASDGLINYAPAPRICEIARQGDLEQAARDLVKLVRLKSGELQDDVSVILCRRAEPQRRAADSGRKRFTLTDDGEMVEEPDREME